ncbi:MAG TPA: DUF2505 domain-containing protein [Candidatus Nanopelagicales bacterium]|nr:DUF2505 domain-containing protein [Candidatus Nanopelagicales bacterium]
MATSLTCQLPIPADPHAAFLLLSDPDYVREVAQRTGGRDIEVAVEPGGDGGATIRSHRVLPARLPSYAKALVGETVTIHETRIFGPAAADGSRDGTIEVTFGGAPAHVTGTMRLEGTRTSNVEVVMSVKASVPFVGGKVERLCADQIDASITREAVVAAERSA